MFPLRRIVLPSLLALFGWMALSVSPRTGVAFDETAHMTAGRFYWTEGDFRFQPENGNLPQRWAALPSLWLYPGKPAGNETARRQADVWWFGREFFFQSDHDTGRILLAGRAMIALLGVALLACIWWWSRALFGKTGGWISIGAAAFSPTLLAHSGLITSDIAAALGFMLALAAWWRLLHRLTPARVILAGLATALLALSKFSSVLLAPTVLLLVAVRCGRRAELPWHFGWRRGRLGGWMRLPALLGAGIAATGVALAFIWSAYGFRYAASPDAGVQFAKPWSEVLMQERTRLSVINAPGDPTVYQPGIVQHFAGWARNHELLPEAFLYGLTFTDYHARARLSYFAGEYRTQGWREFFPTAFLLKTTLPVLIALGLALIAFATGKPAARSRWIYRLCPLVIFASIYWVFAVTSHLNIGHRHLLPVYPALFIFLGVLGTGARRLRGRFWLGAAAILLAWHALESWRVRPHYLTYFNTLAGGPTQGHRYFVDSSLDWGQGLPDLKTWLDANRGDDAVFLSYFGSDEPRRFELNATRIGDVYFDHGRRLTLPRLTAGIYCISATMYHRVYTEVRGPWSDEYEALYDTLAVEITRELSAGAARPDLLAQFEQLRFGRLCHFLRQRQPDTVVGNVFFIYRLDEAAIDNALNHPWREPGSAP